MKKYFYPLNYIRYIRNRINKFKQARQETKINSLKFVESNIKNIEDVESLINFHFKTYSDINHINKEMFRIMLNNFSGKSINILETGSAAHGTKSSTLFIYYVKIFGGNFNTVDLNPNIKLLYRHLESSNIMFHSNDSLEYLSGMSDLEISNLDLVYLDSYDLDINNPEPSQEHGLKEFNILNEKLKKGAVLAIDDTPSTYEKFGIKENNQFNFVPGKGRLILDYLKNNKQLYEVVYHNYGVVLRKN